jgi:predicted small integral membrane protein
VYEAIVLFSLPPVWNAGRHGVNSVTVCSAECTTGTKCGVSVSVSAAAHCALSGVTLGSCSLWEFGNANTFNLLASEYGI